jgi:autotransporter translocation and assembly factor TamB
MLELDDVPAPREPMTVPRKKRRGCLISIFVFLFVIVPGLLLFLNGPGFRLLARYAGLKAAAGQGFTGDFSISGNLWSGFSIQSLTLEGEGEDASSITLEEITLAYRATDLIRSATGLKWLDTLHVRKARIELYLPEMQEGDKNTTADPVAQEGTTATDFSPLWNLLESDIAIEEVTLVIHQGDAEIALDDFSLLLPPGKEGALAFQKLQLPGQAPWEKLETKITHSEHELHLGSISLLEYARLESLRISEPTPGQWVAKALVDVGGGQLSAEYEAPGSLLVSLRQGSRIDLGKIALPLPDKTTSPLRGLVTDLDLRFVGDFGKPSTWKANGNLVASGTGWVSDSGVYEIDSVALTITDNALAANLSRRETTLQVTASAPLEEVSSTHELASVPLNLGIRLDLPSLGDAVRDFTDKIPLTGSLTLEAREVQLIGGKTIQSGSLLILSDNLAWDGIQLSGMQLAANVEAENLVRLAMDLGLDSRNQIRLAGTFDAGKLRYEGEAGFSVDTKGKLGGVLADLHQTDYSGVASLSWKGSGDLKDKDHRGEAKLDLTSLTVKTGNPISGEVIAHYENASAILDTLSLQANGVTLSGSGKWDGKMLELPDWKITHGDKNPLSLTAMIPLQPGTEGGFLAQTEPFVIDLVVNDLPLEDITGFLVDRPPLAGNLTGNLKGRGSFPASDLKAHFDFKPTEISAAGPDSLVRIDFGLLGNLAKPSSWAASLDSSVAGLRWEGMALENITVKTVTDTTIPERPLLTEVRFDQSETTLFATARLGLAGADSLAALKSQALVLNATFTATNLATLVKDFAPDRFKDLPLAGALSMTVTDFTLAGGSLMQGNAVLESDSLTIEKQTFEAFSVRADIPEKDLAHATIAIGLDPLSEVAGDGQFQLKSQQYEGSVDLKADLASKTSRLRKLLGSREIAKLLPHHTTLQWKGGGDLKDHTHEGTLALDSDGLTLAEEAEPIAVKVQGSYTGTSADFPVIELTSRPLNLSGAVKWADRELTILNWKGQSDGKEILTMSGAIPLDREKLTPALWFGQEAPISLLLDLKELPIATVSRLFTKEIPLLGILSADLHLSGLAAAPEVAATLALDQITVPRDSSEIRAGQIKLHLDAKNEQLALTGSYEHPDVKPLLLQAKMPYHPAAWVLGEQKLIEEPLEFSAKMDRSSLAFLSGQVPGIESITGEVQLDAEVSGSLSKPEIRGNSLLDISRLRLADRNAPSLYDINLVAHFAENRIELEKLHAVVAGGVVEGSGGMTFAPGGEPTISLNLNGSEVLVVRTPEVNVRTDLALTLSGPWSKAALSGELGITGSRFFKNFDLLPIGLPTRNTSVLPTIERSSGGGPSTPDLDIGLDIAPFRDWTVDLRVYTKDPFLIRSNLAESEITADLKVGGTIGHPTPNGHVAINEGELSLPFSKVDVETGRIEFNESTGFNGTIEFKAKAKADKYQISIYLFDRILSPQYVLTSLPPLPSEDIITLIATGTTRDDLVGEDVGSMAASKAATLFLKNLRKSDNKIDKEPSLLDLLEERTELELGRVNQETGEQTFGGKIRLWKQLFFVGDVDAESDYRALLKYVFKFR